MKLHLRLYPPLNTAARRDTLELSLEGEVTIQRLIDDLVERFGSEFRQHLYDDRGRIVPAWCLFVNERPVHFNRPEALTTPLADGDELGFLLALAGG
jgi:molybdopterin converting factor small subunit